MLGVWSSLVITYISVSAVLCRFPHLLHKKEKLKINCRHISHRGGAGENLENTMTAFRHAIAQGTDMLEIDVQLTKDGQVVVSHDDSLTRTSSVDSSISQTDYNDLPDINSTLDVTFSYGRQCESTSSDKRIPLLKDLLDEFPTMPLNIDVKKNNDELIEKTVDLLHQYKRQDTVCVGNFGHKVTDKLHKKDPRLPFMFSVKRVIQIMVAFYTGLLPFLPLEESFLEIPFPRSIAKNPGVMVNWRFLVLIADWLLMCPTLFRHLQRRGIQVYVWTVNEEEDMAFCYEQLKVDAVMTDYPTVLRQYLNKQEAICLDEKKQ